MSQCFCETRPNLRMLWNTFSEWSASEMEKLRRGGRFFLNRGRCGRRRASAHLVRAVGVLREVGVYDATPRTARWVVVPRVAPPAHGGDAYGGGALRARQRAVPW